MRLTSTDQWKIVKKSLERVLIMEAYSPNTLEVVIEFILNEYFMNLLIIQCEYTRASHIILDYLQALTLKYKYNNKKKYFLQVNIYCGSTLEINVSLPLGHDSLTVG